MGLLKGHNGVVTNVEMTKRRRDDAATAVEAVAQEYVYE